MDEWIMDGEENASMRKEGRMKKGEGRKEGRMKKNDEDDCAKLRDLLSPGQDDEWGWCG
jgi:hypothetical protein